MAGDARKDADAQPAGLRLLGLRLIVMLLAVAWVTGCGRVKKVTQKLDDVLPAPAAPQLSAEQEVFRKADTITSDRLMPLVSRSATFRYELGPEAGQTIGYYLTADDQGRWFSTFENLYSLQLSRGMDGALLVEGEADFREGRFVEYDPPLRLLPPTMGHRTTVVRQTTMKVRKTPDGKVKDAFECTYKVQLLGMQRVPTGEGERDAYIVRLERAMDTGLFEAADSTWIGFDPARGIIAQRYEKQARSMGVLKRETNWSLVYDAMR